LVILVILLEQHAAFVWQLAAFLVLQAAESPLLEQQPGVSMTPGAAVVVVLLQPASIAATPIVAVSASIFM
jgi:hypothetical protein